MTGCRLHRMRCGEAVCSRNRNSGGSGSQNVQRLFEAMAQLVQTADTTHPDPKIAESYRFTAGTVSAAVFESGQSATAQAAKVS